jgi:uncharacterized protein
MGGAMRMACPGCCKDETEMRFFLSVLGLVMILEGLPYFAFPDKMKPWLKKLMEVPTPAMRRLGFGLMAAGLLLVYLGRLG